MPGRNTVIRDSPIHGRGLFAFRDLPGGLDIEPVVGKPTRSDSRSKFGLIVPVRRKIIITNKTRFINHSNRPNVYFNTRSMTVVAWRDIRAGEELVACYMFAV
jgi:hypothetical protein